MLAVKKLVFRISRLYLDDLSRSFLLFCLFMILFGATFKMAEISAKQILVAALCEDYIAQGEHVHILLPRGFRFDLLYCLLFLRCCLSVHINLL